MLSGALLQAHGSSFRWICFALPFFDLLLAWTRFASVSNGNQRTSSFGQTMDLLLLKRIYHLLETRLHPPHFRTNRVIIGAQKVFPRFVGQRTPRFFKQKDR